MSGKIGVDLAVGLFLRGLGAISGFALLWLIARTLGPEVVGAFQLGLTSASFLAVLAVSGLDILIIREAATIAKDRSKADLRATFRAGRKTILLTGSAGALALLVGGASFGYLAAGDAYTSLIMLSFAPAVPLIALLRHGNGLLRSQGSVLLSQSLEGVFYTSLAAAVVAAFWLSGSPLEAVWLPFVYVTGLAVALSVGVVVIRQATKDWGDGNGRVDLKAGLKVTAAPLIMMLGEWLTLVLLGSLAGLAEAGIYRTAFMICMLFQLVNASFATMAGPHLARAHAAGNRREVLGITRKVGLIGSALVLPLALACLIVPHYLLALFGPEFVAGAVSLQILAVAQTVNVMFGPVGTALTMTGKENQVFAIEIAATSLGVTLALVLIPPIGMLGAAIGYAAATILRNAAARVALSRQPAPAA